MATLDGHYLLAETETPNFAVDITEQPVEKGINITDHVQRKARTVGISGFVVGPDAGKVLSYLRNSSDTGRIIKYVGRTAITGLIKDLTTSHTYSVADGYSISFTIIEVRIASPSPAAKLPAPIRSQSAPIINSGTKKSKSKKGKGEKKEKKGKKEKKEKEKTQKVKFKSGSKWA
ncbi:phage baseplate protein [Paenibacillus spongiae]|uniref:Dit-like phage tail protein N-terminal domain-containing protein n=1 Tax=Paenibacillus spongiae TaxID=2909671 RepID=A0ABY5S2P6_9BACL|nr:hypothetical protein [Paenibacillus spongiae]UVI28164.1 hypothetical protein L1F29_22260 [Paenibacillus spongiae]